MFVFLEKECRPQHPCLSIFGGQCLRADRSFIWPDVAHLFGFLAYFITLRMWFCWLDSSANVELVGVILSRSLALLSLCPSVCVCGLCFSREFVCVCVCGSLGFSPLSLECVCVCVLGVCVCLLDVFPRVCLCVLMFMRASSVSFCACFFLAYAGRR